MSLLQSQSNESVAETKQLVCCRVKAMSLLQSQNNESVAESKQ